VDLPKAKKSNMDRNAIKEVLYGGILELMRNHEHYYYSAVGGDYSHWTDAGRTALAEYLDTMGYLMLQAEEKELDQRAKDIVLNGLKGDNT
jgi:hypothetical protein